MTTTVTFPSDVIPLTLQYANVEQLGLAACLNKDWNEAVNSSACWWKRPRPWPPRWATGCDVLSAVAAAHGGEGRG